MLPNLMVTLKKEKIKFFQYEMERQVNKIFKIQKRESKVKARKMNQVPQLTLKACFVDKNAHQKELLRVSKKRHDDKSATNQSLTSLNKLRTEAIMKSLREESYDICSKSKRN